MNSHFKLDAASSICFIASYFFSINYKYTFMYAYQRINYWTNIYLYIYMNHPHAIDSFMRIVCLIHSVCLIQLTLENTFHSKTEKNINQWNISNWTIDWNFSIYFFPFIFVVFISLFSIFFLLELFSTILITLRCKHYVSNVSFALLFYHETKIETHEQLEISWFPQQIVNDCQHFIISHRWCV